jgi:hypothetical protein
MQVTTLMSRLQHDSDFAYSIVYMSLIHLLLLMLRVHRHIHHCLVFLICFVANPGYLLWNMLFVCYYFFPVCSSLFSLFFLHRRWHHLALTVRPSQCWTRPPARYLGMVVTPCVSNPFDYIDHVFKRP